MGNFNYTSKVAVGQFINLISGLNPDVSSPFIGVVREGTYESIKEKISTFPEDELIFEPFPKLVPCRDWSELVSGLYSRFKIEGRTDRFSGSAAIHRFSSKYDDSVSDISDYLGIPKKYLDDSSGFCFVLVRAIKSSPNANIGMNSMREDATAFATEKIIELNGELEKDSAGYALKTPNNIIAALSLMGSELGTHYVESIDFGDEAFQVFVYTKENYKLICDAMDNSGWDDVKAFAFQYFTSSNYCEYAGNVQILSRDPLFNEILPLIKDEKCGLKQSVFKLLLSEEAQNLASKLSCVVCIGAKIKSITELLKTNENLLAFAKADQATNYPVDLLKDVAVQGCITRFGAQGAGPAICSGSNGIDYKTLYSIFGKSETLSALWSPYLSISQMYVKVDDLLKSSAINKTGIKHLIIIADVVEIQDDVDLSKTDTVTIACRFLITGKGGSVPNVTLSKTSFDPLRIYCGSMIGTCVFEEKSNPKNHWLIFDTWALGMTPSSQNVDYRDFFAGKFPDKVFYEKGTDTETLWRKTSLQTGLEALLMTASVPLSPQSLISPSLKQTAIESWNCLNWIINSSRQVVEAAAKNGTSVPEEIALVYTHSVMQLRAVIDPNMTYSKIIPEVPPLRYSAYESAVGKLLDVSKQYALQIDSTSKAIDDYNMEIQRQYTDSKRDENIKKLSQFLLDQNNALSKHEDDLTQSHNEIINKKQETIIRLEQSMKDIKGKFDSYSNKLEDAKHEMEEAIKKKQAEEVTKAIFEFVFGLTESVIGIGTGIGALKELKGASGAGTTLKKWECFMKFAEQANKLIEIGEGLAEHIGEIGELDKSYPKGAAPGFFEQPNDTDWEIFMNDCEALVKPAEDYIKEEVALYIAAVRNITAIAKEMNEVIAQKSQLKYDIFAENSMRSVSKNQAERLNKLSINLTDTKWTPDNDYLSDLGQFNAVLRQKQNSALLKLAEIVRLQDNSMTYHYSSKPIVITQFDIISIQQALAAQALSAVQAMETYSNPPTNLKEPIEITIQNVSVPKLLSNEGVEVNITMDQGLFESLAHVRINSVDVRIDGVTTSTKRCHVQMELLGNPMVDRGMSREELCYKMISRELHVVYDIPSDKTIIGNQPSDEWGQYFTKPTPFQTFRISLPNTKENKEIRLNCQLTTIRLKFMLEACYSKAPVSIKTAASIGDDSIPNFVSLLKGISVADGWDVVSFLAVDKINKLWQERWKKEVSDEFKGDKTFIQNINISYTQKIPGGFSVVYKLQADAGAPWLTFVADSEQSALITIPLIKGKMTTTTYDKNMNPQGESEVVNIETTSDKPVLIKTKAELVKLPGAVTCTNTVCINPAADAFALENITLDPIVNVAFCNELVYYFKSQKLDPWILGTLRFDSNVDFLKPKSFYFKTYTPPDSHKEDWPSLLALYVLTVTANPPDRGMQRSWPSAIWPVSKDLDAAVYFSADLLWNNEIGPKLRTMIPTAQIVKNKSGDLYDFEIKLSGSVQAYFEAVSILHGYEPGARSQVTEQAAINFDMSKVSMSLDNYGLKLACNTSWGERYPCQGRCPVVTPFDASIYYSTDWQGVSVYCNFSSSSSPIIDKDSFSVTFNTLDFTPNVSVTAGTVPSHTISDMSDSVRKSATDAITKQLNCFKLKLDDMPMFAVSNLLFPESKTLEPRGVYFPYDMVIVGNVLNDWTPPKIKSAEILCSKTNLSFTPPKECYFVFDSVTNRLLSVNCKGDITAHNIYNDKIEEGYRLEGENVIYSPEWDRYVVFDRLENRLLVVNSMGEVFAHDLMGNTIGKYYKILGENVILNPDWDRFIVFDDVKNRILIINRKGEVFGRDMNADSIGPAYRLTGGNIILSPEWDRYVMFDRNRNRIVVANCIGEFFGYDLDGTKVGDGYKLNNEMFFTKTCERGYLDKYKSVIYDCNTDRMIMVKEE